MLKVKWPKIINDQLVPFYGDINMCTGTLFRICMFKANKIIHRKTGVFICVERASSGWIFQNEAFPKYVAEKLLLNPDCADVAILADIINAQLEIENPKQFGVYDREFIETNEPYGLMGEGMIYPIVPEIIE